MKRKNSHFIAQSAMIAALYAALTYVAAAMNLAYGPIQFRFSEALTVLAAYTPAAIPGLTIGCILANLANPMIVLVDVIFGSLATLLASICSYYTRKIRFKNMPLLSLLFPVLFNAIIVGAEITIFFDKETAFLPFLLNAAWVGLGELVVCYAGGIPLALALEKPSLKKLLK